MSFLVFSIWVIAIAYFAQRNNSKILAIVCILSLALFSGFRGENVGIDTPHYYTLFRQILNGGYFHTKDRIFGVIVKVLLNITRSPECVVFIFSSITNILIGIRLWSLREKSSFSLMVFIYISSYYMKSMNVMRQFLAMAIIFWATKYVEGTNKKYTKFIIAVIIAMLFHESAIAGFIILILKIYRTENRSRKVNSLLFISVIGVLGIGYFFFYSDIYTKYSHYFTSVSFAFSPMTLYRLMTVLIVLWLVKRNNLSERFSFSSKGDLLPLDMQCVITYALGIIGMSAGMFFPYMERVGWYFMLEELPFMGQIVRSRNSRAFIRFIVMAGLLYQFVMQFFSTGNGVLPYYTIWGHR